MDFGPARPLPSDLGPRSPQSFWRSALQASFLHSSSTENPISSGFGPSKPPSTWVSVQRDSFPLCFCPAMSTAYGFQPSRLPSFWVSAQKAPFQLPFFPRPLLSGFQSSKTPSFWFVAQHSPFLLGMVLQALFLLDLGAANRFFIHCGPTRTFPSGFGPSNPHSFWHLTFQASFLHRFSRASPIPSGFELSKPSAIWVSSR